MYQQTQYANSTICTVSIRTYIPNLPILNVNISRSHNAHRFEQMQ